MVQPKQQECCADVYCQYINKVIKIMHGFGSVETSHPETGRKERENLE